jgi:SAM-dependent methyltransferase
MKKFKVEPEKQIQQEISQHSTEEKRKTTASKGKKAIRKNHIDQIKKLMPNAKSILCVGCRDKSEVKQFVQAGFNAIGIDIANKAELIRQVDAHEMNKHFEKGEFDLVYASHSLEHMHDINVVLRNIRKVAKMGAFIVLPMSSKAVIPTINHPTIFDIMENNAGSLEELKKNTSVMADFAPIGNYDITYYKVRKSSDGPKELYLLLKFK